MGEHQFGQGLQKERKYFGVSVTEHAGEYLRDTPELSGAEQARVPEIHLKAHQTVLPVSPMRARTVGNDFPNVLHGRVPVQPFS